MKPAHPARQGSSRGLMLLEIVVATAILAMMGALAFATLSQALRTQAQVLKKSDRATQIRSGLLRMARELSMAFLSEHRDCFDPRSRTVFYGRRERFGMRLDFTSFAHQRLQPDSKESDQNELAYYVDFDPDNKERKHLFRREGLRIDERPNEGGSAEVLIEDVESLNFTFYDPKTDAYADTWDNQRPETRSRLPKFVTISIEALPIHPARRGTTEVFTTKTRLVMQPQALLVSGVMFIQCAN